MLGRRRPQNVNEVAVATRTPGVLWTDSLGRVATRCGQALIVLAVLALIVFAANDLSLVVVPVLIALIIASAFRPLVRLLEKHMPRLLAAIISLLAGVVVFGGIITIAVFQVQSQFGSLQKSVASGVNAVFDWIQNGPLQIDKDQLASFQADIVKFVTSAQFGSGALQGLSTAIEIVTAAVLTILVLFYFMKDGPMIWAFLIKPFKPELHAKLRRGGDSAISSLGGYVRGTTIVALVDAVVLTVVMLIWHVPLAVPLGIIVFVAAYIPLVGATAAGIIAALVTLVTVDLTTAIIVAVAVVVVQQLEGNFLSPVVLGRSLRLHGLVVLVALTAGTILGGIIGTLLSVPATAVAWAVIKQWNDPIVPEPGIDTPQVARDEEFTKRRTRKEAKSPADG